MDGWVGNEVGSWRVHGWVSVVVWVVMGYMVGWVVRVHWVGAYTHPHINSYNVQRFNFINTHPPIKHIQSVTLLLYIYSPTHEQL